ncbi:MAG: glycerate kinase [Ignavibacteria bacterium]|nr:glycerate kinase [Ignavibacteria bacterium]
MKIKNILVCVDSFKGTFDSIKLTKIIGKYFSQNGYCVTEIPVADGGEGTIDVIKHLKGGKKKYVNVFDPLGRKIKTYYCVIDNTAYLEMAKSSGIILLEEKEKNPWITSTYGFGQMLKYALDENYRKFVIALGGSATNDGGIGMMEALGYRFFNKIGKQIKGHGMNKLSGKNLNDIYHIDDKQADIRLKKCDITVINDVKNPLYGRNGASLVYSYQKGATEMIAQNLECGIKNFAKALKKLTGRNPNFEGAAAAGGLSASFKTLFNANIKNGINEIIKILNIEKAVKSVDLVIVGEGSVDYQTALYGKAPCGISILAKKYKKKVIAVTGKTGVNAHKVFRKGIDVIYSCFNQNQNDFVYIKANAYNNLLKLLNIIHSHLDNLENYSNKIITYD